MSYNYLPKEKKIESKTSGMSMVNKVDYYDVKFQILNFQKKKEIELKEQKQTHKARYGEIKALKTSSQNVLQFKLDEMTKKMKNEIYRLQEESRRHEDSQKNEDQKINNHINYLKENCDGLDKAFKGIYFFP